MGVGVSWMWCFLPLSPCMPGFGPFWGCVGPKPASPQKTREIPKGNWWGNRARRKVWHDVVRHPCGCLQGVWGDVRVQGWVGVWLCAGAQKETHNWSIPHQNTTPTPSTGFIPHPNIPQPLVFRVGPPPIPPTWNPFPPGDGEPKT